MLIFSMYLKSYAISGPTVPIKSGIPLRNYFAFNIEAPAMSC